MWFERQIRYLQSRYRRLDHSPRKKAERIAHDHGLEVHVAKLDGDVSSGIVRFGEYLCIVLNEDHPETRRTFSLGHELGHFFLHQGWTPPFYSRHSQRNMQAEREANAFSARLLMPSYLMQRLAQEYSLSTEIAEHLGMSVEAVTYRLLDLGLRTEDVDWFFEELPF